LEAEFREIGTQGAVAMTRINDEIFGRQAQLFGKTGAELRQEVGLDAAEFTECDRVDGQKYDRAVALLEHKRLSVERIVDRNRPVRDIGHGRAGFEGVQTRAGYAKEKESGRKEIFH
jgi:hypothetical protein